jgi:recombination protein RecA
MRIGQGRENTKDFLAKNPDIMAEIVTKIRARHAPQNAQNKSAPTAATAPAKTEKSPPEKEKAVGKGK